MIRWAAINTEAPVAENLALTDSPHRARTGASEPHVEIITDKVTPGRRAGNVGRVRMSV